MNSAIKRILVVFLALAMFFSFVACDEETESGSNDGSADTDATTSGDNGSGDNSDKDTDGSTPDNGGSTDKPGENANVLEVLTAAAAKTQSAKSFVLKHGQISEAASMGMYEEYLCTQSVIKNDDGSYISYMEEEDGCLQYYNGNEGYEVDTYQWPEMYAHKISDKPFGADRVFEGLSGFIRNENFIADFCALKPSVSSEEDVTVYKLSNLTIEQLFELTVGIKPGEGDVDGEMYETVTSTEMIVKTTSDGYLSEVSGVFIMSGEIEGQMVNASLSMVVRIGSINEELTIEAPEWSETFYDYPERGYEVRYCYDEYDMVYRYEYGEIININTMVWNFGGIEIFTLGETDEFDGEIIIPVYKVLSEINGMPVDFVSDICSNSWVENVYIQRIVIPDGVNFGSENRHNAGVWDDTVLFFERAEEAEDAHRFTVIGTDGADSSHMQVKAAYYLGEWEWVDGIPTPKT